MSNNIILTGFMGSGKSHFAHYLAQNLSYQFLDTDALIEASESRTISEIFAAEGEKYFRAQEAKVAQWISQHVSASVVATGGGLPIFYEKSLEMGKVFYMDISFDQILSRMSDEERYKRPLFSDLDQARALFESRKEVYFKRAHYTIDASLPLPQMLEFVSKQLNLL